MKKYIFMAVAGMLALSSCSNDDNEPIAQNAPRQMTFTAGFGDGAQTRASLSGKSVIFDANDGISILSANNTNTKFTTTAGGASATFSGTAVNDTRFYAVYPYKDGLTLNSSTGVISGIVIPDDQSAAASSTCGWDPAAPIAYATTTGSSLTFHNACALLKIHNDSGDDVHISILYFDSKCPAGSYALDTSTGALTLTGEGSTFVEASGVPDNKTIYLAVAPVEMTGLRAFWSKGGTSGGSKAKSGTVTFEAGKIYDLGKTSDWH